MSEPPRPRRARQIVGWREWVALPDLGVDRIKAKVDTGAKTSAIHAWDLEIDVVDGIETAHFSLHPVQRDDLIVITASAPVEGWREVRSSNGETERRPAIVTPVVLGEDRWDVELTLARRDEMGFRMLLGRSALRRRYVVDPARSYQGGADRVPPR